MVKCFDMIETLRVVDIATFTKTAWSWMALVILHHFRCHQNCSVVQAVFLKVCLSLVVSQWLPLFWHHEKCRSQTFACKQNKGWLTYSSVRNKETRQIRLKTSLQLLISCHTIFTKQFYYLYSFQSKIGHK